MIILKATRKLIKSHNWLWSLLIAAKAPLPFLFRINENVIMPNVGLNTDGWFKKINKDQTKECNSKEPAYVLKRFLLMFFFLLLHTYRNRGVIDMTIMTVNRTIGHFHNTKCPACR